MLKWLDELFDTDGDIEHIVNQLFELFIVETFIVWRDMKQRLKEILK